MRDRLQAAACSVVYTRGFWARARAQRRGRLRRVQKRAGNRNARTPAGRHPPSAAHTWPARLQRLPCAAGAFRVDNNPILQQPTQSRAKPLFRAMSQMGRAGGGTEATEEQGRAGERESGRAGERYPSLPASARPSFLPGAAGSETYLRSNGGAGRCSRVGASRPRSKARTSTLTAPWRRSTRRNRAGGRR
jgi:hypothetical protein